MLLYTSFLLCLIMNCFMGLLKFWKRWSLTAFLLGAVCIRAVFGQDQLADSTNGPIRLWRNGVTSNAYTSGRVQLVVARRWGNICGGDSSFGLSGASVVCRQLGYAGARGWSTANSDAFGTDTSPAVLRRVNCFRSYLVILQCQYDLLALPPLSCTDEVDISVMCYSTRIWNNPYSGQVRLTGGSTSNQGLVEVYCNEQWGTVCNNLFTQNDADTICRQLGYSNAESYNHLPNRGISAQPIWLSNIQCTSAESCITACRSCPSSQNCDHSQDATIECYSLRVSTITTETCIDANVQPPPVGIYIAIACGIMLCFGAVLVSICCCAAYYEKRSRRSGFTLRRAPNSSRIQTGAPTNTSQPSTQHESPPPAFDLSQLPNAQQSPVETVVTDNQPGTDSTFTEAPPPAYDVQDNYATYTAKSDLPPPYQSPNTE